MADVMAITWVCSMAALSAATRVETKVEKTAVSLAAWWVETTDCEQVAVMAETSDSTMVVL